MSHGAPIEPDWKSPPFDRFTNVRRMAAARSGHASEAHARHQLYVARDRVSRANLLVKVTSKPGLVYEHDLTNEIASLSTINRELPDSRYFPVVADHGRLPDSRVYVVMSLFDEWPLATMIGPDRIPPHEALHLRTTLEVVRALTELHGLEIWHVDLNPMNILCRWDSGRPSVRIVDFESSYEAARHANGAFYSPPTTAGFTAPELSRRAPDAQADVYSLGAVLYTMLAGYDWTWGGDIRQSIAADAGVALDLKDILLRAVDEDPDRRYASIAEMRAALAEHVERTWPGRAW
jgi:serine/threonine protein kinase